jgi:hypothetical protein
MIRYPLPSGTPSVTFACEGNAQVMYQLDGEIMQALTLAPATGPREIPVPPGARWIASQRADAGPAVVTVTFGEPA